MKLLIAKKPIRVYLLGEDFGVYRYNEHKKRYEGGIGYLELNTIIRCINGDDDLDHLEIEEVNE